MGFLWGIVGWAVCASTVLAQADSQDQSSPPDRPQAQRPQAEGPQSRQAQPDRRPDAGLFFNPNAPLPPQLQRDFAPPDPRLPWGYRQYAPSFSQRSRGGSRYGQPYDQPYGYGYGGYGRGSYANNFGRYQGHTYDYGYRSYEQHYPPHTGYGDPYGRFNEEAYRRGVDDGRRFEQFERRAALGLASYLQAMENGLTAFARGDYSSAALSFILAARVNQGDAAARIHAAHAMFALGRHREAIPFLRRAFELQPLIAQLPLDIREDYGRKEDFVEQLHALEDAVAADSDDADLRLLLGYSHLYSRNPAKAYRVLTHAAQLRADDRLIETLLGAARFAAPVSRKK